MSSPVLILASGSPRRRELLNAAGYRFEVIPADVDELDYPAGMAPARLAELLARRKAEAVAQRFGDAVVLGADTVVALGDAWGDGVALGKPTDAADAAAMLRRLSGTTHSVVTGVCVVCRSVGWVRSRIVCSTVAMKRMTAEEISRYVAGGEWRGKAGGYGIQDQGEDPFVVRVEGSASNIVGLPMEVVGEMLGEIRMTKFE